MSGLLLVGEGGEIKKAGARVVGWSPPIFFLEIGGSIHTSQLTPPRRGRLGRPHLPHSPRQTPHLTPHRRGCPRRALFRVFDHLKVFALLFRKNASCDLLRAPRGIPAILWGVRGECGASWAPSYTPTPRTTPSHTNRRGCPRRALFRVFDHPKVFALLFPKNAS